MGEAVATVTVVAMVTTVTAMLSSQHDGLPWASIPPCTYSGDGTWTALRNQLNSMFDPTCYASEEPSMFMGICNDDIFHG